MYVRSSRWAELSFGGRRDAVQFWVEMDGTGWIAVGKVGGAALEELVEVVVGSGQ